jgi:hypothetical protein
MPASGNDTSGFGWSGYNDSKYGKFIPQEEASPETSSFLLFI